MTTELPTTPNKQKSTTSLIQQTPINSNTRSNSNSSSTLTTPRKNKQMLIQELWLAICKRCQDVVTSNDITFEELNRFMMDKRLIELVGKFWNTITSYCKQEPLNQDGNQIFKNGKIILSTLMITKFPTDVLDVSDIKKLDALGEQCYTSAVNVVEMLFKEFENPVTDNNNNNKNDNDNDLHQSKLHYQEIVKSVEDYLNAFNAWQTHDKKKVVSTVVNYYEQWERSYKVLHKSSMNEQQKQSVLNIISNNMQKTKERIIRLVGEDEGIALCEQIHKNVENENDIAMPSNHHNENTDEKNDVKEDTTTNNNNSNSNSKNNIETELKKYGIPLNMKTGFNLRKDDVSNANSNNNDTNNSHNENKEETSKFLENVNGQTVLNLDRVIMEEGSKLYWKQFENEIKQQNWSRLFELLTELLMRLKKLTRQQDHNKIDELIDTTFIEQTIQHGLLDSKGFYSIFYGLWLQMKQLHAPSQDESWDKWHHDMCKQMQSADASWDQLLPVIFNTFFKKLDEIEDAIAILRSHNLLKQ